MGILANLSLVSTNLATLFAHVPKFAPPGQIAVASLSTAFIAVAPWKTSHYLTAEHLSTDYQLQQDVCAQPLLPPLSHTAYTR